MNSTLNHSFFTRAAPSTSGRARSKCLSVLLPTLIAAVVSTSACWVAAQTFTTVHSFAATSGPSVYLGSTNSDGANPHAALILSANIVYGTAGNGGINGNATVFAVNTDGKGFRALHCFTATDPNTGANSDGILPQAGLTLSGNRLYGTTWGGGTNGTGTVFAVNTNGTGFTTLHSFSAIDPNTETNSDGAYLHGGLILSGNILYGTANGGGSHAQGTVFAVNSNGTGFTTLHNFMGYSDGANPLAGVIVSGNRLYGTAEFGGTYVNGTVFALNTNGTGFTTLHSFRGNIDGIQPEAGLILSSGTLYGLTYMGGTNGNGTVFALNTNGTEFRTLHSFTALSNTNSFGFATNSDGANPRGSLILSGTTLYGTTEYGGTNHCGFGTVFALSTNGTGFTTLHSFSATCLTNSDGFDPEGGLILSGTTLYGTANYGGTDGNGTLFGISFTPQLAISHSRTNVILTWPTNVAGFKYTGYVLQSTTNLVSPVVWGAVSPPPVVVNGQQTVTNSLSATQKLFRLSQ